MSSPYPTIELKAGKEQSLLRFHPWVFSGAIAKLPPGLREGEMVRVVGRNGDHLGWGHYQVGSIAVRIVSFEDKAPGATLWRDKIAAALEVRRKTRIAGRPGNNVYRLVHGEGDGMPGLIADMYNGVVVIQAHSAGMFLVRHEIAGALGEVLGKELTAVYDKSEKTVPFKAGLEPHDGYLLGGITVPHEVTELGLRFRVDWETGQKTGFFIDQRENRRLVEQYSAGRKVLNMFSYTGGFSAYAMRGGAEMVHSVDASRSAVEMSLVNVGLTFPGDERHSAFTADAFEFMHGIDGRYDLIILDPPAFAKHQEALPQALKAYKRINARAMETIMPGGILFTFSCSQIVARDRFREAVFSAAAISRRQVRILHQLTQPADHPVSIYHPEGEYLKGLVLYVE